MCEANWLCACTSTGRCFTLVLAGWEARLLFPFKFRDGL